MLVVPQHYLVLLVLECGLLQHYLVFLKKTKIAENCIAVNEGIAITLSLVSYVAEAASASLSCCKSIQFVLLVLHCRLLMLGFLVLVVPQHYLVLLVLECGLLQHYLVFLKKTEIAENCIAVNEGIAITL